MTSAKASIAQEEGLIRYDILRVRRTITQNRTRSPAITHTQGDGENDNEFVLFEVFKTKKDIRRHKETRHYQKWRDAVEMMMETSRDMKTYTTVFPTVSKWSYPTASKKRKRKKDPNMPKRPPNAYMLFAQDHRDSIRDTNPDMNVSEVSRELGVLWRNMDEETKAPYVVFLILRCQKSTRTTTHLEHYSQCNHFNVTARTQVPKRSEAVD